MCASERLPLPARPASFVSFPNSIVFRLNSTLSSVAPTRMKSSQLPNYLRANRKRLVLSQDEMAFLLGTESGTQVSRHENFVRVPNLEMALAYEAIFQKPAREIFDGLYQRIEGEVATRAKTLVERMDRRRPTRRNLHKRQIFTSIANNRLQV